MTVAVLDPLRPQRRERPAHEFKIEWFSGTGKGGQHRNKHQNSARVTHLPTGLVRTAQTRSRESSLREAMAALNEALDRMDERRGAETHNTIRRQQVGSGQRGDKRRTYRFQDDQVWDDITGKSAPCHKVMAGHFELLWR